VALLLPVAGSVAALLTEAELLMLPAAVDATMARRRVVEEAPFAIVPRGKVPVHACQDVPLFVEYSVLAREDGILSVRTTELAAPGPLLFTARV
jgi:hypothetical protein